MFRVIFVVLMLLNIGVCYYHMRAADRLYRDNAQFIERMKAVEEHTAQHIRQLEKLAKDTQQAHDMVMYLRGDLDKLNAKLKSMPRRILTN